MEDSTSIKGEWIDDVFSVFTRKLKSKVFLIKGFVRMSVYWRSSVVVVSLLTTHLNVLFYNNHFIISDIK